MRTCLFVSVARVWPPYDRPAAAASRECGPSRGSPACSRQGTWEDGAAAPSGRRVQPLCRGEVYTWSAPGSRANGNAARGLALEADPAKGEIVSDG